LPYNIHNKNGYFKCYEKVGDGGGGRGEKYVELLELGDGGQLFGSLW
jgi:hypothetical protein